jgi:hypothetical protein
MTPNRAVTAILISSLAGCSSVPQHGAVNFYPANPEANAIGVLTGEYQADGPRLGSLRAVMPDGEVLTGQYAIVSADASGFGSIYTSALTSRGPRRRVRPKPYGRALEPVQSHPVRRSRHLYGVRVLQRQCLQSRLWRLPIVAWGGFPPTILDSLWAQRFVGDQGDRLRRMTRVENRNCS